MSNYKTYQASFKRKYQTPVKQTLYVYSCEIGDYSTTVYRGTQMNLVLINGKLGPAGL